MDPEHDERQLTTVLTVEVVRLNRLMDQELGVRCVLTGNRVQGERPGVRSNPSQ